MNKIQNILLGSALLLTALAACSDPNEADTTLPDTDRQAVMLSVNIEGDAAPSDAARAATRGMQADTRADAGDIAYAPADGAPLCLFYGKVSDNNIDSDQAATYNYDAANAEWKAPADGDPLYWDNLTAASITDGQTGRLYSFYAVVNTGTLNSNSTGGDLEDDQADADRQAASDLMMAYAYTQWRTTTAPIAFTLKHLMAQLTITLKNDPAATGDARFTDAQLAGATATAKLRSGYTLTYPAISSKANAEQAMSTPAKADATGSLKDFTLLSTVHYANDADGTDPNAKVDHISFTCIAPPQALTGDVIITIDGRNYTFTPAAGAITLEAGVNTVQPLIAKKTGLAPGAVTVTDWGTDTKGSADLTADGIYPGDASLTGIKEAGILSLYAYKENDDTPATDKPGTYPVTYDTNSASGNNAAINKNDVDYSPILWDNLTKYADTNGTLQNYTYAATYVPTGYILTGKTTDADNTEHHEKDLLGSISVPTPWGIAPEFVDTKGNGNSTADTRLKHLMARFTVKLTCTDGTYTAAQLNDAQLTTVRKATVDADAPLTVSSTSVTLKTVDAPSSSDPDANKVTLVMTAAATAAGTGTAATDNIAQYSAILAPQTLTADTDADQTVLRLSISGAADTKEYSLKKAITLIAGKDNVLTAKLTQTELSIGEITVKDWDESTKGDGNFEM